MLAVSWACEAPSGLDPAPVARTSLTEVGRVTIIHSYRIPSSQAEYHSWVDAIRNRKIRNKPQGLSNLEGCGPDLELRLPGNLASEMIPYRLQTLIFWYPPLAGYGTSLMFGISQPAVESCGAQGQYGAQYGMSEVGPFVAYESEQYEEIDNPPLEAPPGMEQSEYDALNPAEKKLVWAVFTNFGLAGLLSLAEIRAEAESWASYHEQEGGHNGVQDAMRHAYWQCAMTRAWGTEIAKAFGDAHEKYSTAFDEVRMDLFNNAVGRRLAEQSGTCSSLVLAARAANGLAVQPLPAPTMPSPPGGFPAPPPPPSS